MHLVGLFRARGVAALCALGLVAAGCGTVATGGQQDNEPAGSRMAAPAARALITQARILEHAQARRASTAKRWGLPRPPIDRPPAPATKPVLTSEPRYSPGGPGLPPVISRVPTDDKVVFLTIDDGDEKDPEFMRMMRELDVPYSGFLTHYLAGENYGYFRRAQQLGNGMHNHTLHHRYLPGLGADEQRKEICEQQDNLERAIGTRPRLFRPPFGNFTEETLRIAASCGVEVVPLWTQEAFPDRMEYRDLDQKLHPGDIILTHFRGHHDWPGTMPDVARRVLRTATEQGFAVARLEDYV
jgi:peptidoglycan/xylan/chitin deacetylase (PgdA/CDA1 family)